MNQLMQYLQYCAYTSQHPITFSGDRPNVLNRWLVKKEQINGSLEESTQPYIKPDFNIFAPPSENHKNWRYYTSSHEASSYYQNNAEELFTEDEDKCIYYMCNVFCKEDKNLIAYIWRFNTPMRVWINGELVVNYSYTFNNHSNLFIYNFKKGDNIILVERQVYPKYKSLGVFCEGFEFTFKPVDYYKTQEPEDIYDENVIEACYSTYSILPHRAIYSTAQSIKLMVLPKYFENNKTEDIKISIYDYKNTLIKTFVETTSKIFELDLEQSIKGVIQIKAESLINEKKCSHLHIFRGDFIQERNQLIKAAENRKDCSEELLSTFKKLGKIPALCNTCGELHQEYLYNYLFIKYSEFQNYLDTNDSNTQKNIFDVFKKSALLFKDNDIDDSFIAYGIYLPENYKPDKKYPLVVTMRRGMLLSVFPNPRTYVDKHQFEDAIILNMPGRGDLNLDYINEINCFEIIKKVCEDFDIDKDRLYFIGECAGATKAYGMLLRKPDLAAAVSVSGLPRITSLEELKNLSNTTIHDICNVDNHKLPNIASLYILRDMKKAKNWLVTNLTHLELPEIYNNRKVFENIIAEKKDKYPKLVHFYTKEPYYNKAYWVKLDYISDLTKKAYIKAEIKNNLLIEIITENIQQISLYLSKKYMELETEIAVIVNNKNHNITINNYSKVEISTKEDIKARVIELSEEEFEKHYNSLELDHKLMGIKQTYLKKCIIIKPEQIQSTSFTDQMLYALQNPLKEFVTNYKYEQIQGAKADADLLSTTNYVYFNDARQLTHNDRKLFIKDTNISIEADSISLNHNKFEGEYFAVVKCPNPYNKDKTALFVIYNNEKLEAELRGFWESYYINLIFHSNAVVYNNGEYHSIR